MALILSGAPVAAAITEELIARREALNRQGVEPCLAILRVGARGDDLAYERGAIKRCEKVGIRVVPIALPEDCTQAELMAEIEKINGDDRIHGCLMFRPIPKHLDEDAACEALKTCKDVDSMTAASLKTVFTGRGEGYAPKPAICRVSAGRPRSLSLLPGTPAWQTRVLPTPTRSSSTSASTFCLTAASAAMCALTKSSRRSGPFPRCLRGSVPSPRQCCAST